MGYTEFYENINSIGEKVKNLIDDRKDILIVSNSSCDGIISASLLIKAIWKLGGKATARFLSRFNGDNLSDLNLSHKKEILQAITTFEEHLISRLSLHSF
jgi:single-stranded DNA-specific DHH superfamily exonuclease